MLGSFKNQLVDLLLPSLDGLPASADGAARQEARKFVAESIEIAPHHVRIGAEILIAALWLWALPVGGLPPRQQGLPWRWVHFFSKLPGPGGMVFRLYKNLAVFAYFEHPDVTRHLGLTPTVDRQAAFRRKASIND